LFHAGLKKSNQPVAVDWGKPQKKPAHSLKSACGNRV
jgi:hypothetical protein